MSSETYRQSSRLTELGKSVDPENRLLSRGPRFRADAEIVKDIALTASGLLSRRIGGPPTHPPAPALLFKRPVSFSEKPWPTSTGEGRYRRGLYAFQYISAPYPVFETFDARNGATACVERSRSNTPLQALTTLKEELFMDASRALARRIASTDADDDDQLEHAYRLCLSRPPLPEERALLEELLSRTRSQLAAGRGDPPARHRGQDGRSWLQLSGGSGPRARPACDDPAPAWVRSHQVDVPFPRRGLQADGRERQRRPAAARMNSGQVASASRRNGSGTRAGDWNEPASRRAQERRSPCPERDRDGASTAQTNLRNLSLMISTTWSGSRLHQSCSEKISTSQAPV